MAVCSQPGEDDRGGGGVALEYTVCVLEDCGDDEPAKRRADDCDDRPVVEALPQPVLHDSREVAQLPAPGSNT